MSQHLEHIEINNFKSIKHQVIEGCKRINVFIGAPNVGKSNILEAISLLSYLQENNEIPYSKLCRYKDPIELVYDESNGNNVSIINTQEEIENEIKIDTINENRFLLHIHRFKDGNHIYGKTLRVTSTDVTTSSVKVTEGPEYEEKIMELFKKLNVKKYQFSTSTSYHTIKTSPTTLYFPFGENLVDVVQHNLSLRKEVSELFKISGLKLSIDQRSNSINALKNLDDETILLIPFRQMADTLQRLIFYKAAIMSNSYSVLLFEEPEAHLFPPYIRKFTGDIIFNKENNNQYFINTHNSVVVGDFIEDARDELSVYVVGMKNGETIIKRLSDNQLDKVYNYGVDLFFNIESYLD